MSHTMPSYRVLLAVALLLPSAASLGLGQTTSGTPGIGLPAGTAPLDPPSDLHDYPAFDADGNPLGPVTWRVVEETGNCCENYLTATSDGRLVDLGGQFPVFTDDEGRNWTEVQGLQNPLRGTVSVESGEGATVTAPNGDVLAVSWSPVGDRLQSFKYDADRDEWLHQEAPVHTPFFDRPWLSLVPGPVTVAGQTVPYVTVVKGGFPSKEVFMLSLDGLNYFVPSSKQADGLLQGTNVSTLDQPSVASADWTQPHTESHVTPLPSGSALACFTFSRSCGGSWFRLDGDLRWEPFDTPTPLGGDARVQVPSDGDLHRVSTDDGAASVDYAVSSDGGTTWTATNLSLPANHTVEHWDFKVNADLGFAAVAVHAHNETGNVDQDLVYKVNVTGTPPSLEVLYFVGDGDLDAGDGPGEEPRFDFSTVAILPSGRIATSTVDQAHEDPSVAIQT